MIYGLACFGIMYTASFMITMTAFRGPILWAWTNNLICYIAWLDMYMICPLCRIADPWGFPLTYDYSSLEDHPWIPWETILGFRRLFSCFSCCFFQRGTGHTGVGWGWLSGRLDYLFGRWCLKRRGYHTRRCCWGRCILFVLDLLKLKQCLVEQGLHTGLQWPG